MVALIEAEGAVAELAKRGVPRAVVQRIREQVDLLAFKCRWGMRV